LSPVADYETEREEYRIKFEEEVARGESERRVNYGMVEALENKVGEVIAEVIRERGEAQVARRRVMELEEENERLVGRVEELSR
jgi:hypothetical protein